MNSIRTGSNPNLWENFSILVNDHIPEIILFNFYLWFIDTLWEYLIWKFSSLNSFKNFLFTLWIVCLTYVFISESGRIFLRSILLQFVIQPCLISIIYNPWQTVIFLYWTLNIILIELPPNGPKFAFWTTTGIVEDF